MPRKRRSKAPIGLSKKSKRTIGAIAQKTEEETFEALIHDFDVQAEKLIKQYVRLYRSDIRKILQLLPQKSSIPKEILTMSAYEFKERGGNIAAVMESLRQGETVGEVSVQPLPQKAVNKENDPTAMGGDPRFITPALNTRSKAAIAKVGETGKRKPKALEQVALSVHAATSGSPVDEHTFMELQIGQVMENFQSQLMEGTSTFPQKWRSQLQKQIRQASAQYKAELKGQLFQTPALRR